uniref:Uncharacterized protein n=1 Tax=viral metagenome TaxID=1070528 RepID=A0A6C0LTJ1_9ZZZZ
MKFVQSIHIDMKSCLIGFAAFNLGVICHSFIPDLWPFLPPSSRHDPVHKEKYSDKDNIDFEQMIKEATNDLNKDEKLRFRK